MIVIIVAIIVCVLFTLMSIFQFLLAIGLPLGHYAYGGKYDKLPKNLRIMSVIAIGIFVFAILIVLERARIINIFNNPEISVIAIWIIAGYLALNTLTNAVSKSKKEKQIMTPVSLLLAVCCFILAILA